MSRIGFLLGLGALAACYPIAAWAQAPDPAKPVSAVPAESRSPFDRLDDELAAKARTLSVRRRQATDQDESRRLATESRNLQLDYAQRFFDLAAQDPGSIDALRALRATIALAGSGKLAEAAFGHLQRDWAADPRVGFVCAVVGGAAALGKEPFLRDVIARNPDRDARGLALLAMANELKAFSRIAAFRQTDASAIARLKHYFGQEWLDRQTPEVCQIKEDESIGLYERILKDYPDVKAFPEAPKATRTIGQAAELNLGELRLLPGAAAPDFEAKTLDGSTIRLRDHRGKVIVLTFWGSWCGPCIAQIPAEKQLVQRFAGEPFALIGVNVDKAMQKGIDLARKEGMTWPNAWDDPSPEASVIGGAYKVTHLPTTFVIDPDGKIRHKDLRGESLAEAVSKLLEARRATPLAEPR